MLSPQPTHTHTLTLSHTHTLFCFSGPYFTHGNPSTEPHSPWGNQPGRRWVPALWTIKKQATANWELACWVPNHLRPGQASQTLQGWRLLANYIGLQPHSCNSVPTGQVKPSAFARPQGRMSKAQSRQMLTAPSSAVAGPGWLAFGEGSGALLCPSFLILSSPPLFLPSFPQSVIQQTYSRGLLCAQLWVLPSGWSH